MKKKRKKLVIILIIIAVIIIIGIAAYFLFFKSGINFSFLPDFSAGSNALGKVGDATNPNVFDNTKINPFENST